MDLTLTIILAVLLDHWLGEPKKYHPLIFFGQLATYTETKLIQSDAHFFKLRLWGLLALILMIFPFTTVVYLLTQWGVMNIIINPIILYFCIASKSLKQHASAVFQALELDNLSLAQTKVAMMVSRETKKMTSTEVRKATIESVLENGADAVFAPLFWFILLGPTGAILYRLSNTLDAMWGYKNPHYLHFGWAAAHFDDLLNWLPARLTAFSYALMGKTKLAIHCWKNQAPLLDSPNAGPVMTAGAGSLDLQLGGSAWYHGKLKQKVTFGTGKPPINNDINRANSLITLTLFFWVLMVLILEFAGEYFA
jgi:adenosylcobinamide-phosphate synthase